MAHIWLYTIISVLIVSLLSLIGILTISINLNRLKNILFFLVSFSAGALLGDVFLHLIPEIVEEQGFGFNISMYLLIGIMSFFVLEKIIHWRHCHIPTSKEHAHPFAMMNLVGDGFHNLLDGVIIAGSYMASIPLGIATTLAVVFHEIPQEIGDFGVLIKGGFKKGKALLFNFIASATSILGAIIVLSLGKSMENITIFLIPFTAGGFIYIAGSDLIPLMQKVCSTEKSLMQLIGMILGILVMMALLLIG